MGLSILAYFCLAISGIWMYIRRQHPRYNRNFTYKTVIIRLCHYAIGICMVFLVLLLLAIGIVGTLGHFGSLGHSSHLIAGLSSVVLVLTSAFSATQINSDRSWARYLHVSVNILLFFVFVWVSLTGWDVVQKYLPE
ncbi:hypothetical protein NIES4101_54610 [Calothrix sp. NIES-4101]|nr:hypothetical protein NIES4101_54610 [Calothrix sp. NIES-4101]